MDQDSVLALRICAFARGLRGGEVNGSRSGSRATTAISFGAWSLSICRVSSSGGSRALARSWRMADGEGAGRGLGDVFFVMVDASVLGVVRSLLKFWAPQGLRGLRGTS